MKIKTWVLSLSLLSAATMANDFYVPSTISIEGQEFLTENFSHELRNASVIPEGMDTKGWKQLQVLSDEQVQPLNDAAMAIYKPIINETSIAGVPVVDIKPQGWKDNGKVLVYTHGGAYVAYTAKSSLASSVPVAADTGLRVISVDYTLAPHAKYDTITDQVITVIQGLTKQGYKMSDIAIYGDSAGGGLAAGSVLKMRDLGMELPAAVVLWSPWSDITDTGDSYHTLKDADPLYLYDLLLRPSAEAYAAKKDQKHPYVSPVYGDYSKPFPSTLIQAGTKELFLSNAVRLYQAIDSNGGEAKLDIYEGMWHVFQAFSFNIPEAKLARKKMATFLDEKLDTQG
ncbi:Esterase/lipase-like protein [Shewanella sediminis HAW-EB3]|uniref:Esterase/lipase-like protein n=1 Tax=Shewanella sediminis (strain HAW-EB3) TaxID=425104 RepID=A8FT15_SHESH|nr:alpha/beta hydrolase [Shewanella sediminis]ABV35988.1 Esterase/lipase-like protein [Shewanella sediminis HAW-EB3]